MGGRLAISISTALATPGAGSPNCHTLQLLLRLVDHKSTSMPRKPSLTALKPSWPADVMCTCDILSAIFTRLSTLAHDQDGHRYVFGLSQASSSDTLQISWSMSLSSQIPARYRHLNLSCITAASPAIATSLSLPCVRSLKVYSSTIWYHCVRDFSSVEIVAATRVNNVCGRTAIPWFGN
jgi:hypothetical protein